MGSLLDLFCQSLTCVLKTWILEKAMLAVILGRSTSRAAGRLAQVKAMKITTGRIVAPQELSHRGSNRAW